MSTADQGIAGLLVDKIELTGIMRTARGYVGLFRHAGKPYMLREGDAIADADVIRVDRNESSSRQRTRAVCARSVKWSRL